MEQVAKTRNQHNKHRNSKSQTKSSAQKSSYTEKGDLSKLASVRRVVYIPISAALAEAVGINFSLVHDTSFWGGEANIMGTAPCRAHARTNPFTCPAETQMPSHGRERKGIKEVQLYT